MQSDCQYLCVYRARYQLQLHSEFDFDFRSKVSEALELFSSRCYFDFVGPYFDSKKFLWSEEILRLN
jgi:hypothetical protein